MTKSAGSKDLQKIRLTLLYRHGKEAYTGFMEEHKCQNL
jgi:hypothetical protein